MHTQTSAISEPSGVTLNSRLASRILSLTDVLAVAVSTTSDLSPHEFGVGGGSLRAQKMAAETLQMARRLREGTLKLGVTWGNYKAQVYVTPVVSLSVVVPYGSPISKSLNRAVFRALTTICKLKPEELPGR